MQQFHITLKNEKVRQYNRIAFFFKVIILVLFMYLAFSSKYNSIKMVVIPTSLLIFISLINDFLVSKKRIKDSGYNLFAEYAIALSWVVIGYLWIGLGVFLVGLMYKISKRPLLVKVNKEKITYPSFPQKNIHWSQLNNIILKDGLLTIDFKNNKLIQQSIDENKTILNEQEFNEFCKTQLTINDKR